MWDFDSIQLGKTPVGRLPAPEVQMHDWLLYGNIDQVFTYRKDDEMNLLYWALIFLVVALIAGVLGFVGLAAAAASIARILFFLFLIIFLVLLVMALMGRRPPRVP